MESKHIIRTIVLILVIIATIYYLKTTKEDNVEKEALDAELVITLILAIIYGFTYNSHLWKQYYWIWRTVLALTLVSYLIRVVVEQKRGWWNTATWIVILIFIMTAKAIGYNRKF